MTPPIVRRLRDAAAAIRDERVSMQAMVQAHGPEAHGTLLLLLAMPCLLPVPGVGTVLGLGLGRRVDPGLVLIQSVPAARLPTPAGGAWNWGWLRGWHNALEASRGLGHRSFPPP
jgi:Exopolysaccharide synthesis, ExoD